MGLSRNARPWTSDVPRKLRALATDRSDDSHLHTGPGHVPAAPASRHTGPYTDGLLYKPVFVGTHTFAAGVGVAGDGAAELAEPAAFLSHIGAGHVCATVAQNGSQTEGLL